MGSSIESLAGWLCKRTTTATDETKQRGAQTATANTQNPSETDAERKLAQWLHENAVPTTDKTYETYRKQFVAFCAERRLLAFPATPTTVATFLVYLADERKLSASAVNIASAAINSMYTLVDIQSPTKSALVKAVKKTVKRIKPAPKPKDPITPLLFRRLLDDTKQNSWLDVRDNCIFALLYVGALRESDAMALCPEDAWIEQMPVRGAEEEVLAVFVEKSKNDQERKGHTRLIAAASDKAICPIRLFKLWLAQRDPKASHLFHAKNKRKRLSNTLPNSRLKARLKRLGVPAARFGSHSGRRGGMTEAARKGVEERLLKRHGNWRSDAVRLYIDESVENRLAVSAAILGEEQKMPAG